MLTRNRIQTKTEFQRAAGAGSIDGSRGGFIRVDTAFSPMLRYIPLGDTVPASCADITKKPPEGGFLRNSDTAAEA